MAQRRVVVLGAGALVLVAGFIGLRSVTRHRAGQVLDQGIDQFIARLPPGYTVRHGVVDYNPLTNAATVHDVVVTHDSATIGTADTVTVSGADGQALQDVFDPASYPGGKPAWTERKLLIADASAQNVHVMGQGPQPGVLLIRAASLHRLSGRPFVLPPTPENRGKPEFLADAALALAADTVKTEGADLTDQPAQPAGDSTAGQPSPAPAAPVGNGLSVGSTVISDYDGGKLGSLAIKTVSLDSDGKPKGVPVHMTLGAFDIKTANMRGALDSIRQTGHADRSQLGRLTYESFGMSDVTLDPASGPHLALQDMHATQTVADGGPTGGKGSIHGLTVATGRMVVPPAAAASLAAFGMNAVTMDVDATSSVQANAPGTISEDIVLRDLGALHVEGHFSGYDAARASPAQPLAAIMATTLDRGSIVYEDHSLTNRLIAVAAAQMQSTPEVIRAQLAMPVLTLGLMLPNQPDAADQVTGFLNHPGTLTITLSPPAKTTLAQIVAAPVPARAQMLGVHISSK